MACAEEEEEAASSIEELPEALLLEVLSRVTADAAEWCCLALVCRSWHELVSRGPWPHLRSLKLLSPGGRCPLALASHVQTLQLGPLCGVGDGEELLSLPLHSLTHLLAERTELSPLVQRALLSAPRLSTLDLTGSRVDTGSLEAELGAAPLRSLTLAECGLRRSTGWALLRALRSAVQLTHLDLRACGLLPLSSDDVCELARSLPLLSYLDLSGAADLLYLPQSLLQLPSLATLRLEGCCGLSGAAVQAEVALPSHLPLLPSLFELVLNDCRGLRSEGLHALSLALQCCPAGRPPMLRLGIAGLLDMDDADATSFLLSACARGEQCSLALDVSTSGRLSHRFIEALSHVRLSELRASGLPRLDAGCLSRLAESGSLTGCHTLDLADCERLQPRSGGEEAARAIAAACAAAGTSLRHLCVDGCALDDEAARSLAAACHNLESLSIVGVVLLSDAGMRAFGALQYLRSLALGGRGGWTPAALDSFCSLTSLRLARCSQLDEAGLEALIAGGSAASLLHLRVAACGSLTDAALARLAPRLPRLRSLALHAEDHPMLRGLTLRHFRTLRRLTLTACPSIEAAGIVMLLVAAPDLVELGLPVFVSASLSIPLRAEVPDADEKNSDRPWRPTPRLRWS